MESNTQGQTFEAKAIIESRKVQGFCMPWNDLSSDRGGYKVRLLPNSAKFSPETRLIYSHDFKDVFCIMKDGSLVLTPDEKGVRFEAELPPTHVADDVLVLLSLKRINGCSFRAENIQSRTTKEGDQVIEEYISFDVPEITITPVPAFASTWVDVIPPLAPASNTTVEQKYEQKPSEEKQECISNDGGQLKQWTDRIKTLTDAIDSEAEKTKA